MALPGQLHEMDGGAADTAEDPGESEPVQARSQGSTLRRVGQNTAAIPYTARERGSSSASSASRGAATAEQYEPEAPAAFEVEQRSKEPVVDRHELFSSTVRLAGDRWSQARATPAGLPDMNRSWASSLLGGSLSKGTPRSRPAMPSTAPPTGIAPTAWRDSVRSDRAWTATTGSQSARDWMSFSRQETSRSNVSKSPPRSMTGASSQTGRRGHGVPVNIHRMPRFDTIPCRHSGRRAHHSGHDDFDVRIFFRLPGGSRFAVWVPRDIIIGPLSRCNSGRDIFKDFWGDDAEVRGPCAGRQPQTGRLTPVRALLAQQQANMAAASGDTEAYTMADRSPCSFEAETGTFDLGSTASRYTQPRESLKDIIEQATGISADQMMLVPGHGCRGRLEDPDRPLCNYDVGHGALLLLSVSAPPRKQQAIVTESFKADQSRMTDAISVKAKDAVTVVNCGSKWVLVQTASGQRGKVPRRVLHIEDRRFVADTQLELGLDDRVFKHMEKFRASSWKSSHDRPAKDTVLPLPDWEAHIHPPKLKAEPADEILHFDYSWLRDNNIFDLAGRIRKGFQDAGRAAQHGAALDKGLQVPPLLAELQLDSPK